MADRQNWLNNTVFRSIGPTRGGRVVAVSGDTRKPATFYFGTTGGGVWKTDDGGQYWANVSDGYFKRASVGALAVSESDPNVIYAGMGESTIRGNVSHGDGVYRSTDAGRSWTNVGLERTRNIGKVRVHPTNPDLVYVAAFGHAFGPNPERGLYRSKDGGANWEQILFISEKAGVNDLSLYPPNPRILFAGAWEAERGPYYMSSGGPGSGLWRSFDGGDTWEEITTRPGLPTGLKGKIGVTVSPAREGRVWALVEHDEGGVFRSDDWGDTWEKVNEQRDLRQRAWYYTHITASPHDGDTVWVLNVENWRSIDGGATFSKVPAPHGDNHDIWFDPQDPQRMILGNDGGGTVSFNGGVSWSTLYNQPTGEFYHTVVDSRTPYRVYGAQQDNTTMSLPSRSNNDAIMMNEWYEIGGGESGYIAVRPDNPDIVYAGSFQGFLTKYDHGRGQRRNITVWPEMYWGNAAIDMKFRFNWTSPTVLSPHNPAILLTGGNHVFRSQNEGQSWDVISPDLTRADPETLQSSGGPITKDNTGAEVYGTVFTIAESPLTPGVIWTGSDDGLIHVTRDDGQTWENATPNDIPDWALMSLIEASNHDEAVAYVAATRYKMDDFAPYIYRTRDYGKTWTKIVDGIPGDDYTRVVREDPQQPGLLYAGTETGLYISWNAGDNWHRVGGNLPVVPIHDLIVKDDELVIGTHGRSFWILDDLAALRQMGEDTGSTRLFQPKDSIRWGQLKGFGHGPVPGRNYTFSGGLIPAYEVTKDTDGDTSAVFIDAGNNPPFGVIIQYSLAEEPKEPITLTIRTDAGDEVRSYTSRSKPEAPATDASGAPIKAKQPEKPDTSAKIPAKAGLNRFVWPLTHADAEAIETKGGDQPGVFGPIAKPGDYTVDLTVGGKTLSQSFTVLPDPRVETDAADYAAQETFLLKVHHSHSDLNRAVNRIRAVRTQVNGWVERAGSDNGGGTIADAAKGLIEKLEAVEGELLQVKAQSSQDILNYPVKLNTKIAALGWSASDADARPTNQMLELYDSLVERLNEQLSALQTILDTDVPAFNTLVQQSSIPAVVV